MATVNPDTNSDILDAPAAARASPDADINRDIAPNLPEQTNGTRSESPLSDAPAVGQPPKKRGKLRATKAVQNVQETEQVLSAVVDAASTSQPAPVGKRRGKKAKQEDNVNSETPAKATPAKRAKAITGDERGDPEADGEEEEADEEEVKEALTRPPPVNSDYLPLPWKGRLGYACLNTYLRQSNPPVFCSRTCRIQSILEHRHPLQDPSQPEHPTKNKPDRSKSADEALGKQYLESICLANVRDLPKMIKWNDRYNIKFMRLSSEMFPFASHPEYGYQLAPFAAEALAEAGKVIAQYGHRVTTHPGQFTQLGSPRRQVIDNAIRDLDYHDEMLSLLKLPEQLNRDAVMILHMGGLFEGKAETVARFKEEYPKLSQSIKNRLVLENDDVIWSVHDLLPVCEELNIPMVLDYHHHNIVFDSEQIREGTKDIMELYPRILATWQRKGITPKMHYSEPTPPAITPRQRRKHNPRVATLPPCPPDMDLMIEAKDKEQAVFELMRTFKLPGYDTFNDILPHVRNDDNKAVLAQLNRKPKKSKKGEEQVEETKPELIPEEDVGMGGLEGRVYWPPGMEEWLRPKKREVKRKEPAEGKSKEQIKEEAAKLYAAREAEKAAEANGIVKEEPEESDAEATPATKKAKAAMRKKAEADKVKVAAKKEADEAKKLAKAEQKASKAATKGKKAKAKEEAPVPTPSETASEAEPDFEDDGDDAPLTPAAKRPSAGSRKPSGRQAKAKRVSYAEDEDERMAEA
ncbi:UV-endonuclease UvdE [Teratosphaeria nubilosa]|uniref:UV-endonuclease UvdE n=1 Tax=Teratosphaeria nubilosa TaxID=161662 RepID=A0A6G1KXU5_9PEZI|nr:UV-endonuclease UvdE [Teratosphaeria nubilosa]